MNGTSIMNIKFSASRIISRVNLGNRAAPLLQKEIKLNLKLLTVRDAGESDP